MSENNFPDNFEGADSPVYYQYWKDNGRWFWHSRGNNHEIIAQGETNGYHNLKDCIHGIHLMMHSQNAVVREIQKSNEVK